jgi:hypothetical protein
VLTIYLFLFHKKCASYISAKYSDFGRSHFKIFFRFSRVSKYDTITIWTNANAQIAHVATIANITVW